MSQQFASRREILQNWNPEDKGFWESYGKIIAKENLIVSTAALTLAFCVWYLWSTVASQLNSVLTSLKTSSSPWQPYQVS